MENKSEKKLSETIMTILEHYKQDDPLGIPGAPIPDPMPIPDMKKSFSMARLNMKVKDENYLFSQHIFKYITTNLQKKTKKKYIWISSA